MAAVYWLIGCFLLPMAKAAIIGQLSNSCFEHVLFNTSLWFLCRFIMSDVSASRISLLTMSRVAEGAAVSVCCMRV